MSFVMSQYKYNLGLSI